MSDHDWFTDMDAVALATAVRSREVSPVDTVKAALGRIAEADGLLNACAYVLDKEARKAARAAERTVLSGSPLGPLHGVPVIVKDVVWVQGAPATMGSHALAHFIAPQDAAVVRRLRAAGAIVVAKSTNPEFLWRGYSTDSLHGITRNPWAPTRTPGATSGGSAAAVAVGMAPLALGTDAAGSIRSPASFCGVVGHKPTHGLLPRTPGFEEMRTTNVVGPLARSVRDITLALAVMAGPDDSDALCLPGQPIDIAAAVAAVDVSRLRIAWAPAVGGSADPAVDAVASSAVDQLSAAGCTIDHVDLDTPDITPIAYPTWLGELGDLTQLREDRLSEFGRLLLEQAARQSARDYFAAQLHRARFTASWERSLAGYDALLTPTTLQVAARFGPERILPEDGGPVGASAIANLTGRPAVSVPVGLSADRLPVGLEISARRQQDHVCLALAGAVERLSTAVPSTGSPPHSGTLNR